MTIAADGLNWVWEGDCVYLLTGDKAEFGSWEERNVALEIVGEHHWGGQCTVHIKKQVAAMNPDEEGLPGSTSTVKDVLAGDQQQRYHVEPSHSRTGRNRGQARRGLPTLLAEGPSEKLEGDAPQHRRFRSVQPGDGDDRHRADSPRCTAVAEQQ